MYTTLIFVTLLKNPVISDKRCLSRFVIYFRDQFMKIQYKIS